jgi:hypothetical protein
MIDTLRCVDAKHLLTLPEITDVTKREKRPQIYAFLNSQLGLIMNRKQKLLDGIDVSSWLGLEIGALCNPFLSRTEGPVLYADHATTEELKHKYRNDSNVALQDIVEVDAVWGERTLREAVGRSVDYVVASHVIEHVPDLITWLEELRSVLNEKGQVRLIVPDKRFTFDYLRQQTRLVDILYARLIRARRPHSQAVLDYCLNVTKVDSAKAWGGSLDARALEHHYTLQDALHIASSAASGHYHDIHCWVFTPYSFCMLFAELAKNSVMNFECTMFHDTAPETIEFFVGIRPVDDSISAAESWYRAASAALNGAASSIGFNDMAPTINYREELMRCEDKIKELQSEISREQGRVHKLERELESSHTYLNTITTSKSWKLTEPLRRIKSLLT